MSKRSGNTVPDRGRTGTKKTQGYGIEPLSSHISRGCDDNYVRYIFGPRAKTMRPDSRRRFVERQRSRPGRSETRALSAGHPVRRDVFHEPLNVKCGVGGGPVNLICLHDYLWRAFGRPPVPPTNEKRRSFKTVVDTVHVLTSASAKTTTCGDGDDVRPFAAYPAPLPPRRKPSADRFLRSPTALSLFRVQFIIYKGASRTGGSRDNGLRRARRIVHR